ncbi:MAG TPA: glucoamylase family protein [Gemmatimonadaceae bacterium]|nr:glucoamylase family protein [Gemmatimonadaceae bacterium]
MSTRVLRRLFVRRSTPRDELLPGPIRGELLGAELLADRARTLARDQRTAARPRALRRTPLLARLNQSDRILKQVNTRLGDAAAREVDVGPAGEWLLDNFHVVQEHISEVRESLPRGYYRELPELTTGPLAGYPRVYEVAITLISHTEGRIDEGNVSLFLEAFQQIAPLTIGELWAIPAMLRLGLIENVRRMALRTSQRLDEVELADAWATRIQTANDVSDSELAKELENFVADPPPLKPIFVARFLHQLRHTRGSFPPLVWLEQWIAEDGLSVEEAAAQSTQRIALTQITTANSITSLRAVARMDWRTIVERQSVIETVLREDPSGFYPRMTFETRDRYRHVVERIAKGTRRDEETVARRVVELATAASVQMSGTDADQSRRAHVGYYLVDDGIVDMERALGYRASAGLALHRWVLRHPNLVFVGGGIAVTVLAVAAVFALAGSEARSAWLALLALALLPAMDVAVSVVNQFVTAFLPPRILPKLDLHEAGGIPSEFRTAVVIPTLFPTVEAVHEALETIEVQYLANREAHLHFALLSDFTDSPTESRESDGAIIDAAVDGVRALNARYAGHAQDAFYLFHRPRRWNPRQGVWMGWERKRGKLAQFNRFLRSADTEAFSVIVGDVDVIRRARYVITLDSDTALPPDTAPLLVGALAHPLNRAVYDATLGRVVRGYGILQPRVGVSLPSAHRSHFAAIHSGHPGVDPYTTAVSDVYQDLYGEGSFTGKGIYDVDAFEQATHGRFPENRLLSHDLIEGSYARAGLATDINVYDDYPTRYLTYTRRKHRWIRGDWQLLQWLTTVVPGPDGPERNRLSLLSRWKILDNLRRSLVEIAQLVFLVSGWILFPGSALRWTLLGLGMIAAPWIVSALLAVLRPPLDKSWRAYYAAVGRDAVTSVQQVALAIAFLPHQAWVSADAILRTLWRLFISKRNLLEWQTASQTERVVSVGASAAWRTMWPGVAIVALIVPAVVLLVLTSRDRPTTFWPLAAAMLPLIALWMASPAIAHSLSAPAVRRERRLSQADRGRAMRYAKLHWNFFDRVVTEETNWLAPDNIQDDPAPVIAMRTSPTNIGLQLLATVSAYDLGFISIEDMVRRLELAMRSLERMRRFRGHFYNWYDLRDLRVLEPAYISTVDSGNLAGHLIALRQACLTIPDQAPRDYGTTLSPTTPPAPTLRQRAHESTSASELVARLEVIANRAYDFAMEMDFRFLFDGSRKLFAIGYQQSSHSLDPSYYDLLASEARLASFVAAAKNDVPVEHWFHLGRTLTRAAGDTALVSWSGSMFEYLMPALVMQSFPHTVLDETYKGAVHRQIAHGAEHGVPWGVSESAYNLRDRHLTYQYRAFGVPDLGLKRGLARDLVIAPYAAALAMLIQPHTALKNLALLEELGALGENGFRDAVDYTRPEPGQRFAIVRSYMAHHIGMSLVAFTNALTAQLWQRRFHADPLVRATELLLHERVPRRLVLQAPQTARADEALPDPDLERPAVREVDTPDTPQPVVALLGRLPYTIMVSHAGAGYSRYEELAVTRWRADGTRDNTGQFCYVKDLSSGHAWSATHQPMCTPPDWYQALLATDRLTVGRVDGALETRTEIAVVPEDSAEVRRVTVTNNDVREREVEVTSYGEIVLAPPNTDRAHPSFSNLFVETEWHDWCTAITATRRPRSALEHPLWCVHVVDRSPDRTGVVTCETDRARFIGRGRTTRNPIALETDGPLSGTTGAVLDPIFALRTRLRLAPGQSASVAFTTLVASTRERAFELASRYHDSHSAQRALELAWTSTQIELRELNITPADAALFQELAGHLFYSSPSVRAPQEELKRNRASQPILWALGVSGDWPIVFATIDSAEGLPTLRQLFAAHRYWRRRGMTVDVVVLNTHRHSYLQELNDRITATMFSSSDSAVIDQPGGVFVRRWDLLTKEQLLMLRATARLHVPCDGRSLSHIADAARSALELEAQEREPPPPPLRSSGRRTPEAIIAVRHIRAPAGSGASTRPRSVSPSGSPIVSADGSQALPLQFDNGRGGLSSDGDYVIRVRGDQVPPAPWVNVVANTRGGFLVSERGTGCTWAENSYFYRLTPWHNDPVSDPATEVLYLRDDETGEAWAATPAPFDDDMPYTVRHGVGTSSFEHQRSGIVTHLSLGMAESDPVKLSVLRVTNRGERTRTLSVIAYVEWSLGSLREHTQHQVHTTYERAQGAIYARNYFDPQFADRVAFCASSLPVASYTADRREFLGRNGMLADPLALRAPSLDGTTGVGIDPCAALQSVLTLAPGETRELVIVLGAAEGDDAARRAVAEYRDLARAKAAIARSVDGWAQRLSVITVRTPQPSFDVMLNRWTLYQALACRMWARTALYQSSGAYGFRDQLQDTMAFVHAEPGLAREHILRAAARQFVEGDVQHWWHPQSGRGVRTRFSDDLAWLPYVVDHYVRVTGDASVLDESVPFLEMRALEPHEHEVYDLPRISSEHASVYEHCVRALRRACTAGARGLPLIGIGDWNDGMNRVGVEGQGESVWLAWFLITTLRLFADHAERLGDEDVASDFRARADAYAAAVEAHGWDGDWYRRAYFDDGTPVGSAQNDECRIDSIAQSWSVISEAGMPERQTRAMRSLEEHLVREDAGLILLLTPPFDKTPNDPGYIKGYLPGVRENGAQYTHAALWAVLATALRGDGDRAFELFQLLNPLLHTRTPEQVATYKVEPYVVAADVYAADRHVGRGGWTWYTGSASWMYRVGLEGILGFTRRGEQLTIRPRVPRQWPEFTIEYRFGRSLYVCVVQQPGELRDGEVEVCIDGQELDGGVIMLVDDGARHDVVVRPRSGVTSERAR